MMGKFDLIGMAAMPAAASENQLGKLFGASLSEPQMPREARRYRQAPGGPEGAEGKLGFGRKDGNKRNESTGRKPTERQSARTCDLVVKQGDALGTARGKEKLFGDDPTA